MGARESKLKPKFFATPAQFRKWLEKNHESTTELWVGYYKKSSGRKSITWPESVDEALCFGWIDGIRRSIDEESYTNRFTPRRATSTWSNVNVGRVKVLTEEGRMRPAGLAAFEKRRKVGVYSFEQPAQERVEKPGLDATAIEEFKKHKAAWAWFEQQAPWYQRTAGHWVTSAVKPETRARRLAAVIADCEKKQAIGPLKRVKVRQGS